MIDMQRRLTPFQGNKQGKMELKIFYKHSFTSIIFHLGFLLMLNQPKSINGLCTLQNNTNNYAQCDNLNDIEFMTTFELNSLKVLSVGKNLYSNAFENLTSLKHLDLSNGILSEIETNSFQNFHNLHSLNLSNNHLHYFKTGTLSHLKHLHSLNLSKNLFKYIPMDIIQLKHLKYLDLSQNNIKCNCKTLKQRDLILKNGVTISNNTVCSGLHNVKGKLFIEPDTDVVCMLDEQDLNMGMQGDQPIDDHGSGEGSGDAFDEIEVEDIPEDDETPIHVSSDINITTSMAPIEIPLTPETTTPSDDELFFTEEIDKQLETSTAATSSEITTLSSTPMVNETENKKKSEWGSEGSGDDDTEDRWTVEGSGFEGSGIGIVPPINWDNVDIKNPDEDNNNSLIDEGTNLQATSTTTTTEGEGLINAIFGIIWPSSTGVESTTANDLSLEEEQFIPASSTTEKSVDEEIIIPPIIKSAVETKLESSKENHLNESRNGKIQAEIPIDTTESPDASPTKQTRKGMGSYVVLALLLGVLATLIGFAAYKSDICRSERKRNNNGRNLPDLETGTELKDLTKSLLDKPNSTIPKISPSNGEKLETIPLVTSSGVPTVVKNDDEPIAKYVGTLINESTADPIKPPRKSFSPNDFENAKKHETNGKIITEPELPGFDTNDPSNSCPRPITKDVFLNGKNDRDSLSSIGDSPSSGSHSGHLLNPQLSEGLPPESPHAQRVKITLQDNPDSVPKTPLLITRTKAGENLVKTT